MAPYTGTQQWHHQSWPSPSPRYSTLQWHPAMAPSNGTLRLHPAMAPRPLHPALAPWCHVQSAKAVRRPSRPIGSKNPYSYRYLGKNRDEVMLTESLFTLGLTAPLRIHHHFQSRNAPGKSSLHAEIIHANLFLAVQVPVPGNPTVVHLRWRLPVSTSLPSSQNDVKT